MSQSGIEWTDWSLNPVKGKCPVACPYCYARPMYDRFRWDPDIRFVPSVFDTLPQKPLKVFVGSTMELFLFDDWMEFILNRCQDFPQHTFQFLTKKPDKLPQWSPYPKNCWVGGTATDPIMFAAAYFSLANIKATVKYISLEPFLNWDMRVTVAFIRQAVEAGVGWLIIGALTSRKRDIIELAKQYPDLTPMPWGKKWTLQPPIEWVEEVVRAADQVGLPVFLKPALAPMLPREVPTFYYLADPFNEQDQKPTLRQEMPDAL